MPKTTKDLTINLLSHTSLDATKLGQTIKWMLTAGKAIVFLTFLIVMSAFGYRFYLDKQLETLQETMNATVERIQEYSDAEPKMRALQSKLDTISKLTTDQQHTGTILTTIESDLPSSTVLESLELSSSGQISLKGTTQNEIVFAGLLDLLKQQPEFTDIVVDELRSGGIQNPLINFSIRFKFSPKSTKE